MPAMFVVLPITSIVFCGAIFGFFYAWVCSTMWGLDQADPRIAIEAMQAMNGPVRNGVFFPAFSLTPSVLIITSLVLRMAVQTSTAAWFVAAAVIYLALGLRLTMAVNVPMNEALAAVPVPTDIETARKNLGGLFWAMAALEPSSRRRLWRRPRVRRDRVDEIACNPGNAGMKVQVEPAAGYPKSESLEVRFTQIRMDSICGISGDGPRVLNGRHAGAKLPKPRLV